MVSCPSKHFKNASSGWSRSQKRFVTRPNTEAMTRLENMVWMPQKLFDDPCCSFLRTLFREMRKCANFSVDRIQRLKRLLRIPEPLRIWRESDVATKTALISKRKVFLLNSQYYLAKSKLLNTNASN
jgi:hypothetical protein